MSNEVDHQSRPLRSEYRERKTRDFYDEKGQHLIVHQREVDHDKELLDPGAGNLTVEIRNENNNNRSQQLRTELVTSDPFTHQQIRRLGEQAVKLGGNLTTVSYSTGNATGGVLPAPTANSLTLLASDVQHLGRAHYEKTDVSVGGWSEITLSNETYSPKAYGNELIVTGEVVAPGTAIPSGNQVLTAKIERIDDEKSWLEVVRMPDGPGTITEYDRLNSQVFGAETVANITLVPTGTAPGNATFLTVSLEQKELGNNWDEVKNVTVEEWPTLYSEIVDETTGALIQITKTFVPAGTEGSFTAGNQTEIKEYDRLKSISINAKWKTAPSASSEGTAIVLPFTDEWQIPPVLVSATAHYVYAWAITGSSRAYSEDLDLEFKIRDAYSVSLEGRIKLYYSATPAVVTPATYQYKPVSNSVIYKASWWYFNSTQAQAQAQIRRWQTAPVLVPSGGVSITGPSWFTDANLTVNSRSLTSTIPQTDTPPTGWTTIKAENRKIKLGYYEVRLYQLNLPDPFA